MTSQDETITEEKVSVTDVTITEPKRSTRRGTAAADVSTLEADTTVDGTATRSTRARRGKASADVSVIDAQPVPKPRASKR